MPTATKQLARINLANGSPPTALYTVPAGRVTIVKEFVAVNTGALGASGNVVVVGGVATTIARGTGNVAAGGVVVLSGYIVLAAGDLLRWDRSALSSWMIHVSGSELVVT